MFSNVQLLVAALKFSFSIVTPVATPPLAINVVTAFEQTDGLVGEIAIAVGKAFDVITAALEVIV